MIRRPATSETIFASDMTSCLTARFQNHFEMGFTLAGLLRGLTRIVVAREGVAL
jgi:hypothetical protein